MKWVYQFYESQDAWSGVADMPIHDYNRENAGDIIHFMEKPTGIVLELGAGGGKNAAEFVIKPAV